MILSFSILLMALFTTAAGVAPTIDLSHNMRILKLPMDTKIGSVIYRLRGSDPDNDVLTFGVRGDIGNQLLDIRSVTETRANVFLKSAPTEKEYKLTIYVTDGIQTTEVESSIIITNATNQKSPFLEYESLITVSELTEEKEVIGNVVVRKRNSSSLPVLFELEGSDNFAIRYLISPLREATKGEIFLLQKLDYEKKNLFTLDVYALNPWTDEEVDTRNVAVLTILVAVEDAQDTPPVFHPLPPVIRVSDSLSLGANVTKITAEDGDYGNQRNVTYSFVPGSQGVTYFNIHSRTGMITLASSIELLREAYSTSGPFVLSIKATEVETELIPGPPESSEATLAVVLVNTENRPPRFTSKRYVATVEENSPSLTSVTWEGPEIPKVFDDDQGKNGSFELFLEGDGGAFSVQPGRGMNELNFAILVKDPLQLDYETSDTKYIEFRIVARETASVRPLTATAEIRVKLLDANDNIPQFSHDVYNVTLPEDAPPGTTLTRIQATDEDSGSYGVVRYTAVNGPIAGNLRLDPVTGELTLVSGEGLDRERIPEYTLTVEARDDQGKGNRNTAEVHVTLADANDNAPLFLQPRYDAVLNPDMRNFYEPLRVQAYDADGPGPNSDITYEIVNGNYQEKFLIDPHTGELSLKAPLVPNPESQDHGLPVITLTVRAHDQGVPVRFATVKVQVHNQEYLNRSISFIVPLSARKASERRQELERGFSALTGAHVNVHSVAFHNSSSDKSIVRCWVSYPLSSTVDLSNMDVIIGNLYGREYYLATTNVEAINRGSFNVVFWLLIVLVILMLIAILALLIYCCCVRTTEGGRDILEVKNKVAPEENIIHYKDGSIIHLNKDEKRSALVKPFRRKLVRNYRSFRPDSRTRSIWQESQQVQTDPIRKNHIRTDEERPSPSHRAQQATVHDSVTTSYAQNPDDIPVRGAYYPDGGIPEVAGGRMERAYRRGRPLSPSTEMLVQEMAGDSDARRLGNYVVVRKVVRPRVRVDAVDERAGAEDTEDGPRRTEILYIRSPMREEEEERQYVRDGELLRSVSETALNTGDPHLRVPRPYRQRIVGVPQQRSEPPQDPAAQQQLKFSRYHRTEGDVIVAADDAAEMDRPFPVQDSTWVPPYNQQGEYSRPLRQQYERWEAPEYGPQRAPDEYRNLRYPAEPPPPHQQGYIPQQRLQQGPPRDIQPQPIYRDQYIDHERESQRDFVPVHHQETLPRPQPQMQPAPQPPPPPVLQRIQEQAPKITEWQVHQQIQDEIQDPISNRHDDDEDARTVIMAPASSKFKQTGPTKHETQIERTEDFYHQQIEQHTAFDQSQSNHSVSFKQETAEISQEQNDGQHEAHVEDSLQEHDLDEKQQDYSEDYRRRQSIPPRVQPLSTEDSEALSSKDKLEPDDTDLIDSRETHEESDRFGPRTTEDDISRTEDQNPPTDGEDEDSDSGIGKDGTALRLKKSNLMEKKSLFTIAYDGMQTRGLKSAGERDDSP